MADSAPPPSSSSVAARDLALAQQGLDIYSEGQSGRYRLTKQVGKGAYGAVYSALESFPAASGVPPRKVAIKHIINAFVTPTDARRIYREIKVQAHFNPAHPNILPLLEVIKPRDALGFTHIYIVSELMETDLHRVVHSRQDLTSDHISYFIYQTLCALRVIHAAHILHRDLKPSNLLANADCSLKMCDFGLARESDASLSQAFTEYVVTRWYRAPEVLLSGGRYTGSIDVWSVGCILGELLLRRPLFPGEHYLHQLQLITEILGSPTEEDLAFVTAPAAHTFMLNLPKCPGVPFAELFPHVRGPCLDLLRKMLLFDPKKRITVEEALEHPFLTRVRAARRGISEDATPIPKAFKLRVHGGSSALKAMTVDKLKERFYAELCGLAMTPTPSTPSPHGGTALFASLSGGVVGAPDGSGALAAAGSPHAAAASAGAASGIGGGGGGVLGSLPRPNSGSATLSPLQAHSVAAARLLPASGLRPGGLPVQGGNGSFSTAAALATAPPAPSTMSAAYPPSSSSAGFGGALGPRGAGAGTSGQYSTLGHGHQPPRGGSSLGGTSSAQTASTAAAAAAMGKKPGGFNSFLPTSGGFLPPPRGVLGSISSFGSPPKTLGGVGSGGSSGSSGSSSSAVGASNGSPFVGSAAALSRYTSSPWTSSSKLPTAPSSTAPGEGAGAMAPGDFIRNRYGVGAGGGAAQAVFSRGGEADTEGDEDDAEEDEEYGDDEDDYDFGDVEDGGQTLGGIKEGSKEGSFEDSMVDSSTDGGVTGASGNLDVGGGNAAAMNAAASRAGFSGMFGVPPQQQHYQQQQASSSSSPYKQSMGGQTGSSSISGLSSSTHAGTGGALGGISAAASRQQAVSFVAAYGVGGSNTPPRVGLLTQQQGHAPSPPPGPPPQGNPPSLRTSMAALSISNAAAAAAAGASSTPPKVLRPSARP